MKKILVIDDSKTIRALCEWMYQGLEDKLFTADSVSTARVIIDRESPDVIIVDYTLPEMDSYTFVSTIKDRAKVIMLGGTYAPFDVTKAITFGAVGTLMKPFKSTEFFDAVEAAMNATVSAAAPEEEAAIPPAPIHTTIQTAAPFNNMPISPAPSYASAPVASPFAARMPGAPDAAQQPKSTINSINPIGGFVAPFGQSANPSNGIAPIGQHVGPAPIKRFTFPGTDNAPKAPAPSQTGTPAAPLNPFSFPGAPNVPEVPPVAAAVTPEPAQSFERAPQHANPFAPTTPANPFAPTAPVEAPVSAPADLSNSTELSAPTELSKPAELSNSTELSAPTELSKPALSTPAESSAAPETSAPAPVSSVPETTDATAMSPRIERVSMSSAENPAVRQTPEVQEPAQQPVAPQIDPDLLRAEVVAAVKSLLPAIVNSYLKKLIQVEVKPQLQKWVDTRVESLIRKMNDQQ